MARTITGTIKKPGGNVVWPSVEVRFTLVDVFFATTTATYPKNALAVTTDGSGAFSVTLATPDTGTVRYRCDLPDGESFEFDLATGSSETLQAIIAAGVFPPATAPAVYLRENGAVAGATSTPQDFGTHGIKADVIAESSSGLGVTIDGVPVKDGLVARTGIPWGKNTLVVDAKSQGSYSTLSAALAAITDASASNPYTIIVVGYVAEVATVTAKSYVSVHGLAGAQLRVTNSAPGPAVSFTSVVDTVWSDLKVSNLGANATVGINLVTTDDTVELKDLVAETDGAYDAVKLTSGTITTKNVTAVKSTADAVGNDPGKYFNWIGGGYRNKIEDGGQTYAAVIVGGYENEIDPGPGAAIVGGIQNVVSASHAVILGGSNSIADGDGSVVLGGQTAKTTMPGEVAQAYGRFQTAETGGAQTMSVVMHNTTTNATPGYMSILGYGQPGLPVPADTVWTFSIKVSVLGQGAVVAGGYTFDGCIKNASGAVTLVSTPIKTAWESDAGLDADAEANDTTNCLDVKITGLAATNLRWVAFVRLVQATFPA